MRPAAPAPPTTRAAGHTKHPPEGQVGPRGHNATTCGTPSGNTTGRGNHVTTPVIDEQLAETAIRLRLARRALTVRDDAGHREAIRLLRARLDDLLDQRNGS